MLVAIAIPLTVTGCTSAEDDSPAAPAASSARPTTPAPTPSSPSKPVAPPLVLAISVDGLNPDALEVLGARGAPHLHRLVREGVSTLNARTAQELTITLPNHTGMLTGRGVSGRSGHGVTFNDDIGGTLATTHGAYVPGVFDVVHDHGLGTAFFAEKEKFGFLMRSWDGENGAPDVTGPDDGRDKTDIDDVDDADALVSRVGATLSEPGTSLVFLHLSAPDQAGHADGWLSASYLDAVRAVDRQVGVIIAALEADPAARERATLLLTADHGGARGETSHSDMTRPANYRVPFIAWGRGVAAGADLYALNPGRSDPGDGRPDYAGRQPVRNIDIANTALSLLGLPLMAGARSTDWPVLRLQ